MWSTSDGKRLDTVVPGNCQTAGSGRKPWTPWGTMEAVGTSRNGGKRLVMTRNAGGNTGHCWRLLERLELAGHGWKQLET
eukprot:12439950-Alexandrium_andersonii.AAC.1